MTLLDAALSIAAVPAHIPLADRARWTRNRVGPSYDAGDKIANVHAGVRRRLPHRAKRFMADHQAHFARRRPTEMPADNFAVGAAYTDRQRAHQNRTI